MRRQIKFFDKNISQGKTLHKIFSEMESETDTPYDGPRTGRKHYLLFYQSIQGWFKKFYENHKEDNCCCIAEEGHLELADMSSQNPKEEVCCWRDHEEHSDCTPTCYWTHRFFYKGLHRATMSFTLFIYSLLCGWIFEIYDIFYFFYFLCQGKVCPECADFTESFFKLFLNLIFNVVKNFLECIWCIIAYSFASILNLCCCFGFGCCLQHLSCLFDCPERSEEFMEGCAKCWKALTKAMEDPNTAK